MASFKAREVKKGLFEILGLDAYIEKLLARRPAKRAAPKTVAAAAPMADAPLQTLLRAFQKNPRRNDLLRAGAQKDQLLRSLIPLYVARGAGIDVTSGLISNFWRKHGVKYAAPNAAKALREHVGYARQTKTGREITPNGVKYVEAAARRKAA